MIKLSEHAEIMPDSQGKALLPTVQVSGQSDSNWDSYHRKRWVWLDTWWDFHQVENQRVRVTLNFRLRKFNTHILLPWTIRQVTWCDSSYPELRTSTVNNSVSSNPIRKPRVLGWLDGFLLQDSVFRNLFRKTSRIAKLFTKITSGGGNLDLSASGDTIRRELSLKTPDPGTVSKYLYCKLMKSRQNTAAFGLRLLFGTRRV